MRNECFICGLKRSLLERVDGVRSTLNFTHSISMPTHINFSSLAGWSIPQASEDGSQPMGLHVYTIVLESNETQ